MKLTYRGINYEYTPPQVEPGSQDAVGKYRGVDIRFRNLVKSPVQQPTLDLIYRGVNYTVGSEVDVAPISDPAIAPAPARLSLEDQARSMMLNHHRRVKQRQQAMLSRLDAEVGIEPTEAAHYWNHIQGKVHPSFWATYDRHQAAFS
jgi:hypothetical protein